MPSPQRLILNKGHGMSSIQRTSGQRRLESRARSFSTKLIVRAHASSLPHTPAGIQHRYPTCPKLNGLTFVKAHHFRYPVVLRKGMKQTSISFHDAAWFSGIPTTGYYTLYIEGSEQCNPLRIIYIYISTKPLMFCSTGININQFKQSSFWLRVLIPKLVKLPHRDCHWPGQSCFFFVSRVFNQQIRTARFDSVRHDGKGPQVAQVEIFARKSRSKICSGSLQIYQNTISIICICIHQKVILQPYVPPQKQRFQRSTLDANRSWWNEGGMCLTRKPSQDHPSCLGSSY